MNGKGNIIRAVLAAVMAVYIIVMLAWWQNIPKEVFFVSVPPGTSAFGVASILARNKIVESEKIFLFAAEALGKTKRLRAGTYSLSQGSSIFKVIKEITGGRSNYVKITVPEGYTAKQIAARLSANRIVNYDRFLEIAAEKKAEGYLFPETYYFERFTPEEKIIERMTEQFKKHYTEEMKARAEVLKMTDNKIITLASIVEKEAVKPEERPLIAGIFYNRLRKWWYLESCATIQYALGKHKEKLKLADLNVDSPYNTYRHFGLPPGPICSPGMESIKAALYPAETELMFFVVESSGSHTFSQYYDQHLQKKTERRRKLRQKN